MVKIRIVTMEVRIEEQGTGKHLNEEVRQGKTIPFQYSLNSAHVSMEA